MGVGTPSYDSAGIKYIPVEIPGTNFFPSSNNPSPSTSSMFRPYTPSPVDTRTILQNIAASPPPPFYPEPLPGFGRPQFKSPADSLVKNIPGLQVFGGNGTTSNIPAIPNIPVQPTSTGFTYTPIGEIDTSLFGDNAFADERTRRSITETGADTGTGIDWFGKDGVVIPGLNALSNLSNAIVGYQHLGLVKEAFDFNKQLSLTNLANQARTTNADILARERSQLRQRGGNIPGLEQLAQQRSKDKLVKGTL